MPIGFLDLPHKPDQKVRTIWAWIAIYTDDGTEGIISADMPFQGTTRHLPLMSSQRHTVEALAPLARKIQREATNAGYQCRVVLREFVAR